MREIKISERGFGILCLLAFRQVIDSPASPWLTSLSEDAGGEEEGDTIESTVLNNLEHINASFKCQMMQEILHQFRLYDDLEGEEDKWRRAKKTTFSGLVGYYWKKSPHCYLDRMFNALKEDYKATHNGEEWRDGVHR